VRLYELANLQGGGALYIAGGQAKLSHVEVSSCSSNIAGGAIQLQEPNARLEMRDSRIESNHARKYGGGMYVRGDVQIGAVVIANTTFAKVFHSRAHL
jgi:hypothetical protein